MKQTQQNVAWQENGSRSYLISIVMVAVLGGLLFGYDTAVISGAEQAPQAGNSHSKYPRHVYQQGAKYNRPNAFSPICRHIFLRTSKP